MIYMHENVSMQWIFFELFQEIMIWINEFVLPLFKKLFQWLNDVLPNGNYVFDHNWQWHMLDQ